MMLTGYPSIDKPWLKWYSEETLAAEMPNVSMYQYVHENNKDYLRNIALQYFGTKITYRELFENIDKVASAFSKMGVNKGSVVTIMSMHTPEMIYCLYALNKLGAVANLIYMTLSENEIAELIKKTNSIMFLYLDVAGTKVKNIEQKIKIPMITLPLIKSMPLMKRLIMGLKKMPRVENGISYNRFLEAGKNTIVPISDKSIDGSLPAVIVYTSGTTGEPKGVVHTNTSLNAVAFQYSIADMNLNHGDTYLNAIPPFLGFGISVGIHTQLGLGMQGILHIKPEAEAVAECFIKTKPMHMIIGPAFINEMTDVCSGDMSWLRTMAGGGGAVTKEQESNLNTQLKVHNSDVEYIAGYGMTEFGATVCTNMNRCKRDQALGIPFSKTNVKVLDVETGNELGYDQVGELCFSTPNLMLGYKGSNGEEITTDDDGTKWFRTGDLGHVDADGFVFFDGRLKRIYLTRSNDGTVYKLFPARIEELLMKHKDVELCGTIAIEDENRLNVPVAFVSLIKGNNNDINNELMQMLRQELPDHFMPEKIVIMERMPITQSGKIDYRELEKIVTTHCRGENEKTCIIYRQAIHQ